MSGRDDGGPVFPEKGPYGQIGGMSLRDHFAGRAMAAMWAGGYGDLGANALALAAYGMADAMLAARKEGA